jgi:peptidoglycan/LPS O-acetylase OafA/YrhL
VNNQTLTYTPVRLLALACFLAWAALAAAMLYEIVQKGSDDFFGSEVVFASAVCGVLAASGALGVWLRKPAGAVLVVIAAAINHFAGVFSDGVRSDYNWGLTMLSAVLAVVVSVHSFLADKNHA